MRAIKAKVIETLLMYRWCAEWTLGHEHFAALRTARHHLLVRIIGFQRRQRTAYLLPYAQTLKKLQRKSVETIICKQRRLLSLGPYSGRTMSG